MADVSSTRIVFKADPASPIDLSSYDALEVDFTDVGNASGGKKDRVYALTAVAIAALTQLEHFAEHELDLHYKAGRINTISVERDGRVVLKDCTPQQAAELLNSLSAPADDTALSGD